MAQATRSGTPTIAIIGTGFGGLCMAIQLENAGITSFVLLEKGDRVGGTWRDNTYPGAACDVQSLLYSFSFAPKSDWTRKYAPQKEIHSYLEGCADTYGLRSRIQFNKEVVSADFDEAQGLWTIATADGASLQAHVMITACGQLNRPAIPRIKGIETFAGKTFHSARWDHGYDFTGKTVAAIGTGASSIQFVPQIMPKVKKLTLFQRSAAWIIAKPDRPYTALENWLFKNIPVSARLSRFYYYLKNESRALAFTRLWWITRWVELETKWLAWRAIRTRSSGASSFRTIAPAASVSSFRTTGSRRSITIMLRSSPKSSTVSNPMRSSRATASVIRLTRSSTAPASMRRIFSRR